jgi:hypothetical protein
MDRYGGDFYRRPMLRYGGEYQQWGGMPRYDRGYMDRGGRGGWGGNGQQRYGRPYGPPSDPSYWYGMRDARGYPSPWEDSHPGVNTGFGLGFGQGRGQFIYK